VGWASVVVVAVGGRVVVGVVGGRVVVVVARVVVVLGSVVVVACVPLPVRAVRTGGLSTFQTTASSPVAGPAAVGVKMTVIVQGVRVAPRTHVPPVREIGPVKLIELRVTGPLGVNVTVRGGPLSPTVTGSKATVAGVSVGGANWAHAGPPSSNAAPAPATSARMPETATDPTLRRVPGNG
jgi:hypothetical protein